MGKKKRSVENAIYDQLGENWYSAKDDPVALLRAESRLRNPWVATLLRDRGLNTVLDVGCGGGLLSNFLAFSGFQVTAVDQSLESLEIARRHDETTSVRYIPANALHLPFEKQSFDAVCAMDFLEHVEDPFSVIQEAARVLRPGGMFFFHTFNRNFISWLVVIQSVEWMLQKTPKNLHVLRLFLKPGELTSFCEQSGLQVVELRGVQPNIFSMAFFKSVFTRRVEDAFEFKFSSSLSTGYTGYAIKN